MDNQVYNIIRSNDTNYIVGIIVAVLAANILHKKNKNQFYYDKKSNEVKIVTYLLFLISITVIYSHNMVLSGILSILLLSMIV